MVAWIYCAFVTPSPRLWCSWAFINSLATRDPAISDYFARASSNNNKSNRCFFTLRTSEVSPTTLAIAQILQLTNPSTFVEFQHPLTLLLRFKAMLTLKAFLHSYHFVFVFLNCTFIQGIWRSFTKNCHPRLLFQRQIGRFGSATSTTRVCSSSSCITHSMLGMTVYRIWSPSHAMQTKRRPCSITWKFFAHWLRFYNRFKKELGGDPILFPAEPNQFSAVVDKVMVGATADMRRLADEPMKAVYIPSQSRRSHALLPKNHVQTEFGINLRLTILNFYVKHL